MTIIFFVGQGVTEKAIHVEYNGKKYIKNDFVKQLRKITEVIIPDIKFHHIYYYDDVDVIGWKKRYNKIKGLSMNDINISKYIKNLEFDKKKKYILMGHSAGIYFALEFALQYPKNVERIISLDGSWITVKLCKQRLLNWRKRGKKVNIIKNQKELNELMKNVLKGDKLTIRRIFDHTRYEHTNYCIKKKYQNILKKVKFTVFRDFNGKSEDVFNEYALLEHDILSKIAKDYQIYWQINAGHSLWFNKIYKKQIVNYIKYIESEK